MKGKAYRQVEDGGFVKLEFMFKTACCDCGLVHVWKLRKKAGVKVLQVWRDNRATGQRRRKRKVRKLRGIE